MDGEKEVDTWSLVSCLRHSLETLFKSDHIIFNDFQPSENSKDSFIAFSEGLWVQNKNFWKVYKITSIFHEKFHKLS